MPSVNNLFLLNGPTSTAGELFEDICRSGEILIERIISTGQSTPEGEWYDQEKDEWVVLLSGQATLHFASGELIEMVPGDHLLIPAHCRHRVKQTSENPPCVWIAVHGRLVT
jgi:cupin 2 domain-containing protein